MKYVAKYGKPYLGIVILILVMKLGGAVLDLMIPSTLADMLDVAVPTKEVGRIVEYGLRMVLFAFLELVLNFGANVISSHVSNGLVEKLRQDLFVRVSHLSARQLDQLTIPSAVSRLTSDTYNVNNMVNRCLRIGVRAPILMLGGLAVTFSQDAVLTIVLAVALPLVSLCVVGVTRKSLPLYREKQSILDRMIRTVQENVTGIRVIKALSKTEYEKDRYDRVNDQFAQKSLEAGLNTAKSRPITNLILHLSLVCVLVLGAWRVNGGHMLPGRIVAFISYFTIIVNATLGISGVFVTLTNGAASAQRIAEIMDMPDTMPVEEIPPETTDYAVEFRNVDFSYDGVEKNLDGISFALKKGETLGIIGATGSGKTTLIHLLLRFYDADGGQILLGGQDIRGMEPQRLREMFGVVFQNDFLVADTVENNIDFYRGLGRETAQKAAALAQAEKFIAEKEGGLSYPLAVKGNNLSGGQKQRLLIARALASDPEILVLDDASSALDYRTDAALRQTLAEHFKNTTKIIVAQRVSSIRSADHILVLEDGRVLGYGTHEELLSSCEEYRTIAEIQMDAGEEAMHRGTTR